LPAWHHGALYPQAPDALALPVLRVRNYIIITNERYSFWAFPWIPGLISFARNDGFLMWLTFIFFLFFLFFARYFYSL
jgi:hypothetical protein